jgi:hypothetical protein
MCLLNFSAAAIDVMVSTSKTNYYVGEDIKVLVTVPTTNSLLFNNLPQTYYTMDNSYVSLGVLIPVGNARTTPYTWTNTHSWNIYGLVQGLHSVVGTVIGYGNSMPASFQVIPTPVPKGNLLIDFDLISGTTAPVASLQAYDAIGVHFHNMLGSPISLKDVEGNSWTEGFVQYPVGFHVIVDFEMPVFGASAKVSGGTGVTMTMMAKNSGGTIIASSDSTPITQPGQFTQTLSLRADERITSIEWWPSIPNSSAGVDDLFVITTPYLTPTVAGDSLRITWPSVAGDDYQLWFSTNLHNWSPWGSPVSGTGDTLTNDCPIAGPTRFFRLSKSN